MTTDLRQIVIAALDHATGLMDKPDLAPMILRGEDLRFDQIGMDSLTRFEALMEIEERLAIELDDDELTGHETLSSLVAYLQTRVGAHGG